MELELFLNQFLSVFPPQPSGISEEIFRQLETVQNRYDSSTAAAFRAVQKSGEMVVRTLDPRQFIRLASETAPKINIDTNVSDKENTLERGGGEKKEMKKERKKKGRL